jgi:hypothetical protein
MDRQLMTYGITTMRVAVGLSAVTHLSLAPNVVKTEFIHIAGGGTLFMGGATTVGASLATSGVHVPAASTFQCYGQPDLYFFAAGATTTIHVVLHLGAGFAGAY